MFVTQEELNRDVRTPKLWVQDNFLKGLELELLREIENVLIKSGRVGYPTVRRLVKELRARKGK